MSDFIFIILPLIVIGIAMVLLITGIKKKDGKSKKEEEDYTSQGMCLGMCFGVAIGSIFVNKFGPNAISYGICFGMLGGVIVGMIMKKK